MSPLPLGTSQSLKNSLISLKVENLASCSTFSLSAIHPSGSMSLSKKLSSILSKLGLKRAQKPRHRAQRHFRA